jgi:hypothetical protein
VFDFKPYIDTPKESNTDKISLVNLYGGIRLFKSNLNPWEPNKQEDDFSPANFTTGINEHPSLDRDIHGCVCKLFYINFYFSNEA